MSNMSNPMFTSGQGPIQQTTGPDSQFPSTLKTNNSFTMSPIRNNNNPQFTNNSTNPVNPYQQSPVSRNQPTYQQSPYQNYPGEKPMTNQPFQQGGGFGPTSIPDGIRMFFGFDGSDRANKYPPNHPASTVCAWLCMVGSFLTVIVGLVFIFDLIVDRKVDWSNCNFFTPGDCNVNWRQVFTLNPIILIDLYTPIVLGVIGVSFNLPRFRIDRLFPVTWFTFGWWMTLIVFVGNIGYASEFGVVVGIINSVVAFICFVVFFTIEQSSCTVW